MISNIALQAKHISVLREDIRSLPEVIYFLGNSQRHDKKLLSSLNNRSGFPAFALEDCRSRYIFAIHSCVRPMTLPLLKCFVPNINEILDITFKELKNAFNRSVTKY